MTTQDILIERTQNDNKLTLQNDASGWFALSRTGLHYIEWDNGTYKQYANEKSWAKRVSQLIRTGK